MSTDRSFNAPENSNHPSRKPMPEPVPHAVGNVTYVIVPIMARFNRDDNDRALVFIARQRGTDGKWCDVMNGKEQLWSYKPAGVAILLDALHVVRSAEAAVIALASDEPPAVRKLIAQDLMPGDMIWSANDNRFRTVDRVTSDRYSTTVICRGEAFTSFRRLDLVAIAADNQLAMAWNVESERKANGEAA